MASHEGQFHDFIIKVHKLSILSAYKLWLHVTGQSAGNEETTEFLRWSDQATISRLAHSKALHSKWFDKSLRCPECGKVLGSEKELTAHHKEHLSFLDEQSPSIVRPARSGYLV